MNEKEFVERTLRSFSDDPAAWTAVKQGRKSYEIWTFQHAPTGIILELNYKPEYRFFFTRWPAAGRIILPNDSGILPLSKRQARELHAIYTRRALETAQHEADGRNVTKESWLRNFFGYKGRG